MRSELKLKTLSAGEISSAVGGKLYTFGSGGGDVTNVTYDSREVASGTLFCAIKGEKVDGHDFIKNSVEKGASVVLASKLPEGAESFGDYSVIIVDDTVKALGELAGYYRSFSRAKAVGVTGSVGKTTTKDYIASVLSASFKTQKTEGNHNNEIGFPMTLFSLEPDCEAIVLEMGMSSRGEISFLTRLAKPVASVITNIGTSHIANLGSRENICLAKLEIAEGMDENGKLFMNGDEPLLTEYRGELTPEKVFFGIYNKNASYKAVNIRSEDNGMVFDVLYNGHVSVNVGIPTLGRHNVYNALAAFAVGKVFGMNDDDIKAGLSSFVGTKMRQKIYKLGDITVIEDCYNAAPESMRAAIEVLASKARSQGGSPCALLGDMLELGDSSRLLHDQLGQFAAQMKIEKLYCFGEMAETVAEAAIKKGVRVENVYVCTDINDPAYMAKMIASSIGKNDVLLVKASRGIAAERVIEEYKKLI